MFRHLAFHALHNSAETEVVVYVVLKAMRKQRFSNVDGGVDEYDYI